MEGFFKAPEKKTGTKADCYRAIQELAIARDKVCQHPSCSNRADCGHHVYGRGNLATAFLPEGILGVCTRHHTGWAHGKPKAFKQFMIKRLGEERYYELRRLSNTVEKNPDYNEIYHGLQLEIKAWSKGA